MPPPAIPPSKLEHFTAPACGPGFLFAGYSAFGAASRPNSSKILNIIAASGAGRSHFALYFDVSIRTVQVLGGSIWINGPQQIPQYP